MAIPRAVSRYRLIFSGAPVYVRAVRPKPGVELRRASPLDVGTMGRVYLNAYRGDEVRDVPPMVLKSLSMCLRVSCGHCVVAEIDSETVGMGCLFPYRGAAWIGGMAVERRWQRRGIGTRIMAKLLEMAENLGISNIGLDATEAGKRLYRKFGFVEVCEVPTYVINRDALPRVRTAIEVLDYVPSNVAAMDRGVMGFDRSQLLNEIVRHGALLVSDGGYAFVWWGRIGPLVANSLDTAIALISRAVELGARRISIPLASPLGRELVKKLNLCEEFRCTRMVQGSIETDYSRLVAIASYAFG